MRFIRERGSAPKRGRHSTRVVPTRYVAPVSKRRPALRSAAADCAAQDLN